MWGSPFSRGDDDEVADVYCELDGCRALEDYELAGGALGCDIAGSVADETSAGRGDGGLVRAGTALGFAGQGYPASEMLDGEVADEHLLGSRRRDGRGDVDDGVGQHLGGAHETLEEAEEAVAIAARRVSQNSPSLYS